MKRLQNIYGCFAYILELASNNLDTKMNIRIEQLFAVAELVNNHYEATILFPLNDKEIWVEIKEYYKTRSEVVKIVPSRRIDWKSGKITVNDPCEWEMILLVSHHFTFFPVNVAFSLLSSFLDMFVPSLS